MLWVWIFQTLLNHLWTEEPNINIMKFNPMLTTVLRYFVAGLFYENGQQKQTVQLTAENYYGSTPPTQICASIEW